MMKRVVFPVCILSMVLVLFSFRQQIPAVAYIRINQLGYTPNGIKAAVWCSRENNLPEGFALVDAVSGKAVFSGKAGKAFGAYGPFTQTCRLDFSAYAVPGKYFLQAGETRSPEFSIDDHVYKGAADFCLRYMRQQRSGFNPFLKDSCHTHDGFTLYGPMPDSTHIDVTGGWHDASDYLQYSTTTANATWHLLAAYRDFPAVFGDEKNASGLDGKNKITDVLDEAKWGLDWLMKMNPRDDLMFNQLGDDRDHMGMRIPKEDTNYYGKGMERPVYFVSGKPQVRGKFMNASTGTASTAGKFASAFALASSIYRKTDTGYARLLHRKSLAAYAYGSKQPGVSQTASVKSPYIYAEGNWADDMELAATSISHNLKQVKDYTGDQKRKEALDFAKQEPVTPWLGADTAHHYQWYPFTNQGHYELAKQLNGHERDAIEAYYETGIRRIWARAKQNAFYRGIPFIWCSNNLTVSFALQCYWYRRLTGNDDFAELEQANFDWLFGCNPWGTSMVYGLPAWGDTPVDPHSAFTHLKNYPIDGGLVDGPVYTAIYKNLIGIRLMEADEYAAFQSDLAVYHDDYGDYSTNEPTMDGTASLIYLLAAKENEAMPVKKKPAHLVANTKKGLTLLHGAVIKGDSTKKELSIVFTADEYGEGLPAIIKALQRQKVKGAFFFTGRFYRNRSFQPYIKQLNGQKHYLGPHSDQHLLYNDWNQRDSLLVTKDSMLADLERNEAAMRALGIHHQKRLFIPPYEWWNKKIGIWCDEYGVGLFSFTPGTKTNADYTWPGMGALYKSSDELIGALKAFEKARTLNGAIILIHAGTDTRRADKLYNRLEEIIGYLKQKGYRFKRVDELLF